jgi:N-acetylglucosamine PTS system EIICBA or EIICB component
LTNALGIHDGFGFSAGAIDYLLNFDIATRPLLLIQIGLGYAAIYYFTFRWVIRKWNLRTPGREEDEAEPEVEASAPPPPRLRSWHPCIHPVPGRGGRGRGY